MERLTIRVPEEILAEIEHIASADDVSQSEAARQLLRRGSEYDRVRDERDRLREQLAARMFPRTVSPVLNRNSEMIAIFCIWK